MKTTAPAAEALDVLCLRDDLVDAAEWIVAVAKNDPNPEVWALMRAVGGFQALLLAEDW